MPDAFFTIDGIFETLLTVLDDFGAFPAVIDRELRRYLPFLATTKMLVALVKAGVGREVAHDLIRQHSVAAALAQRAGAAGNDLLDRMAADERVPLDLAALDQLLSDPISFVGAAPRQVAAFVERVAAVVEADPTAANYTPADII